MNSGTRCLAAPRVESCCALWLAPGGRRRFQFSEPFFDTSFIGPYGYNGRQVIQAAYLMGDFFVHPKLRLVGGARAESTRAASVRMGTYDAAWQTERWPYFPADFSPTFFQAAPASLQRDEPRGGEPFLITSVRPDGGDLRGRLPEARPRAFAARQDGSLFEVLLRLDTLLFDADAARLHLIFRGSFDIDEGDASGLFVLRDEREGEITLADLALRVAALAEIRLAPTATAPALEKAPPPPPTAFQLASRLGAPSSSARWARTALRAAPTAGKGFIVVTATAARATVAAEASVGTAAVARAATARRCMFSATGTLSASTCAPASRTARSPRSSRASSPRAIS